MIVKTFEGINMKDALSAVKSEFGPDAIILETTRKTMDETNTAIIEIKAAAAESRTNGGSQFTTPPPHGSVDTTRMLSMEKQIAHLTQSSATKKQLQHVEGSLQEIKLLLLETLRNKNGSMIENLPPYLTQLEQNLRITGISDTYITELIGHLQSLPQPNDMDLKIFDSIDEYYKSLAVKWVLKRIKIAPKWDSKISGTSVHLILGTPGSGKTTTIAKLAAHFIRKEKSKVLLISYDNIRLGASDQLRIYAKILGADFVSIGSAKELPEVLQQHRNVDIALIDTAGRSPRSSEELKDIEQLKECPIPIESHLLLPITEKENQLQRTIQGFSEIGLDSLIFSKLDEGWTYGEIFNLSKKWSVPLSFFTTGQEVPDDIERASRERVIERIFNL